MKIATNPFWANNRHLFDSFDRAFLFGSALNKDSPQDIDLVLIYSDKYSPKLRHACDALQESVFDYFGLDAHLTVLSESENAETRFLDKVKSVQIK